MFQPSTYPYAWNGVTPAPSYGQPQLNNLQAQPMPAQQPQIDPQMSRLYGRVVNTSDEITPNDIPTNGTIGLFPQSDYSCIFAKQWNNDGRITTIKFVPEAVSEDVETSQTDISEILERLDNIETLLVNQRHKNYNKNYRGKRYSNDKDRNQMTEANNDDQSA